MQTPPIHQIKPNKRLKDKNSKIIYFLKEPPFLKSCRFLTSLCVFLSVAIQNMQQISLSISILAMVNRTAIRDNTNNFFHQLNNSFAYDYINVTCTTSSIESNSTSYVIQEHFVKTISRIIIFNVIF